MNAGEVFFDTNVVLYLLSAEQRKADRAEALIAEGGRVSVQVLNEFAAVASRKLHMPWAEIREVLSAIRQACSVDPVSMATHERGLWLAERYGLFIYDATILAAAWLAGCKTLYSDDLQDGQVFDGIVTVRNPFR